MKTKESTIDLADLFKKQNELTNFFRSNNNITSIDWNKSKGSIICELWEMTNELKSEGFKNWTTQKRTPHALEELTDVLFFYLQTGNDLGVVNEHYWIEYRTDIMEQVLAVNTTMLSIDGSLIWMVSFAQYRGLVQMLGYDWEKDIIPMYHQKYEENIRRQKQGY